MQKLSNNSRKLRVFKRKFALFRDSDALICKSYAIRKSFALYCEKHIFLLPTKLGSKAFVMNRQLDTGNKIDKNERKTFTVRLFYLCEGFYHLYALGAKHSNILSSHA